MRISPDDYAGFPDWVADLRLAYAGLANPPVLSLEVSCFWNCIGALTSCPPALWYAYFYANTGNTPQTTGGLVGFVSLADIECFCAYTGIAVNLTRPPRAGWAQGPTVSARVARPNWPTFDLLLTTLTSGNQHVDLLSSTTRLDFAWFASALAPMTRADIVDALLLLDQLGRTTQDYSAFEAWMVALVAVSPQAVPVGYAGFDPTQFICAAHLRLTRGTTVLPRPGYPRLPPRALAVVPRNVALPLWLPQIAAAILTPDIGDYTEPSADSPTWTSPMGLFARVPVSCPIVIVVLRVSGPPVRTTALAPMPGLRSRRCRKSCGPP
jgi:hypothetical protein